MQGLQNVAWVGEDENVDRDEVVGMFRLVYAPTVRQIGYSARADYEAVDRMIRSSRYYPNCIAWVAGRQACIDDWFDSSSDMIEFIELVSQHGSFLTELAAAPGNISVVVAFADLQTCSLADLQNTSFAESLYLQQMPV